MIATDVLDSDEAAEGGSIDNDGAGLGEEDKSYLREAGLRTCITQSVKQEVEEVQWVVKYFSLLSYILKPTSLISQDFTKNNKA